LDPRLRRAIAGIRAARPPRAVASRIVAIDGPGGAGKTSLAEWLGRRLDGAPTIHTDDFASWDDQLGWWPRMLTEVLEPLAAGRAAVFMPTSWDGHPRDRVVVEAGELVILEGVASSRAAFRPYLSYSIWVETPSELRLARGLARDGESMRPQWGEWMAVEDRYLEDERPADHADLVLPGDEGLWALP
jgi:uridine kinase